MKRFKIGDKVVALQNRESFLAAPIKKGDIYTVKDVSYCCKCGVQSVDVGFTCPEVFENGGKCSGFTGCFCGNSWLNNGTWWIYSKRFAYPEELQAELKQAVAKEEYELASELRDLINNK